MTGGETLIGVGALAGFNIIAFAYSYGKSRQYSVDLGKRVERIEIFLNGEFKQMKSDTMKLTGRIIRLETLWPRVTTLEKTASDDSEPNEDNVG
uniref:Uncharacterized protein n=1 Tax=viral metagenome TaxID=1070528 RepID=A0A6M3IG35_9ZZZZ